MKLYLSNLNILHHEDCNHYSQKSLVEFIQLEGQSDFDFLVLTITYLVKYKKSTLIEICPYCLGKRFNLLSPEFNIFRKRF